MIWLTWRQHRSEALFGAIFLVVSSVALVLYGMDIRGAYSADGMGACLHDHSDACLAAYDDFISQFTNIADTLLPYLGLAFGLVGAVVGGPLLAREYEHGTWGLAWTQTVPRTRWLLFKLGFVLAGLVVFTATLSAVIGWYRAPLDAVEGRWTTGAFDFEGASLTGYTLFSFALGVLAGLLLRRMVAAIVVAYLGFLAVRLPVEFWIRPGYQTPVTTLNGPPGSQPVSFIKTRWDLDGGWADATGHHLSAHQVRQLRLAAPTDPSGYQNFLRQHHVQSWLEYQPAGRFWTFQFIEFGIFAGLAAVILALAIWRLRRHGL